MLFLLAQITILCYPNPRRLGFIYMIELIQIFSLSLYIYICLVFLKANVLSSVQEEINRRVSINSLCGCLIQFHALDLLCTPQVQFYASHHH